MTEIARDPSLAGFRSVFGQLLAPSIGPLAPGFRVPDDLWEIRNRLASDMEIWKQRIRDEARTEGRMEGEAAFLLRQLEHRFGSLPMWAR